MVKKFIKFFFWSAVIAWIFSNAFSTLLQSQKLIESMFRESNSQSTVNPARPVSVGEEQEKLIQKLRKIAENYGPGGSSIPAFELSGNLEEFVQKPELWDKNPDSWRVAVLANPKSKLGDYYINLFSKQEGEWKYQATALVSVQHKSLKWFGPKAKVFFVYRGYKTRIVASNFTPELVPVGDSKTLSLLTQTASSEIFEPSRVLSFDDDVTRLTFFFATSEEEARAKGKKL